MQNVTKEDLENARRRVISQLSMKNCKFDLAATLTFSEDPITFERAEMDFRHLMNRLNRQVFGNNWKRRSKKRPDQRVAVFAVHENGYGRKQIHYHCAFATPKNLSSEKFAAMINLIWAELRIGGEKHNKFVPIFDEEGWLDYILKEVNLLIPKNNDKIDTLNMHTY